MTNFFSKLFRLKDEVDFVSLLKNGAILVDVRTAMEYKQNHTKNSINIPLDELNKHLSKLEKGKPIITICQSGVRSRSASHILKQNGFIEVYNGGCWSNFVES